MSGNYTHLKSYCTIKEAVELTGRRIFGPDWTGEEPNLPRPPVPPELKDALSRRDRALKELLRVLHGGRVKASFIPEGAATFKEAINSSSWPSAGNPSDGDVWIDLPGDSVTLKPTTPPSEPNPAYGPGGWNTLWPFYAGRAGRVEIDFRDLTKALTAHVKPEVQAESIAQTAARNAEMQRDAEVLWKANPTLTKKQVAEELYRRGKFFKADKEPLAPESIKRRVKRPAPRRQRRQGKRQPEL